MVPIIPLWTTATKGRSAVDSAQLRVNLYADTTNGDKSPAVLYGRPGLVEVMRNVSFAAIGGDVAHAYYGVGCRGAVSFDTGLWTLSGANKLHPPGSGECVVGVSGSSVFAFFNTDGRGQRVGGGDALSSIETSSGPVSIAGSTLVEADSVDGIYELAMVDGSSFYAIRAKVLTGTVSVLNLRYDPLMTFLPIGATSLCSIASRIVANDPAHPGRFYWSPVGWTALNNGPSWNALDYATAESNSDALVAVWESRGELVLFGSRTIEVWGPSGDSRVFARLGGSGLQWGLVARGSLAKHDSGTVFVGTTATGAPQVCYLRGYDVTVVSTPDIDHLLATDRDINGAVGCVIGSDGHTFYVLSTPSRSLVFDFTSMTWAEWRTAGGRFCGDLAVNAFGKTLVADYRSLRWYVVDHETMTDGGERIERIVTTRHLFSNLDPITVRRLQVDCETGTGISDGQGSVPKMFLEVSKDGGRTFGPEVWRDIGKQGEYRATVAWNGLGVAEDFVFRLTVADPVRVTFLNGAIATR